MELILIRHGLPEKVVKDDGGPADPPLSAEGLAQADKMAAYLKDEKIDRLYSSPMQRAYQTALPLAAAKNMEIELEPGVAEYDKDSSAYIPVEELKDLDYDRWLRLMQGETDINFPVFADTVCTSLDRIIADNAGKRVAVTCHGGVVNVWAAHVVGFEPRLFFNPTYTSISRFMASSSGSKTVVTLNEHFHLK
ncbi:MAG: putative phosphoglycerate mutase [Patiriisocius sp.]|jgi:probable phosphoglycerate mutase